MEYQLQQLASLTLVGIKCMKMDDRLHTGFCKDVIKRSNCGFTVKK